MTPAELLLTFDYRDCVDRAARICGGHRDLAGEVNAPVDEVVLWTLGVKQPCITQFVRILELIQASRT